MLLAADSCKDRRRVEGNYIYAFDARGKQLYKHSLPPSSIRFQYPILLADGSVVLDQFSEGLVCYDARGKRQWNFPCPPDPQWVRDKLNFGNMIISINGDREQSTITALREDGTVAWTYRVSDELTHRDLVDEPLLLNGSALALVSGDYLFVASKRGIHCIDAAGQGSMVHEFFLQRNQHPDHANGMWPGRPGEVLVRRYFTLYCVSDTGLQWQAKTDARAFAFSGDTVFCLRQVQEPAPAEKNSHVLGLDEQGEVIFTNSLPGIPIGLRPLAGGKALLAQYSTGSESPTVDFFAIDSAGKADMVHSQALNEQSYLYDEVPFDFAEPGPGSGAAVAFTTGDRFLTFADNGKLLQNAEANISFAKMLHQQGAFAGVAPSSGTDLARTVARLSTADDRVLLFKVWTSAGCNADSTIVVLSWHYIIPDRN